jgi:hypothetical protein
MIAVLTYRPHNFRKDLPQQTAAVPAAVGVGGSRALQKVMQAVVEEVAQSMQCQLLHVTQQAVKVEGAGSWALCQATAVVAAAEAVRPFYCRLLHVPDAVGVGRARGWGEVGMAT